ncbi:MAG: flagellar export chaperone FlgN [Planctomycetes bacterium]|nr:flagellar export chaperone FlgN [Planctomycetota bacterium]
MEIRWEEELSALLTDLSAVQTELLDLLSRKRQLLVKADLDALAELQPDEEQLAARLQVCHDRRAALLQQAAERGLPAASVRDLTAALPRDQRQELTPRVKQTAARARLLQHQSLANWVLAQRTVLHLSQMLEIIATGGRLQPTYGKENSAAAGGSLVDQAV